jgi:hypothetical protein
MNWGPIWVSGKRRQENSPLLGHAYFCHRMETELLRNIGPFHGHNIVLHFSITKLPSAMSCINSCIASEPKSGNVTIYDTYSQKAVRGLFWPLKAVPMSTAAGILLTHQLMDPLREDHVLLLELVHHQSLALFVQHKSMALQSCLNGTE